MKPDRGRVPTAGTHLLVDGRNRSTEYCRQKTLISLLAAATAAALCLFVAGNVIPLVIVFKFSVATVCDHHEFNAGHSHTTWR
jgi:hypothetical protein